MAGAAIGLRSYDFQLARDGTGRVAEGLGCAMKFCPTEN
jgi:hypothetical protein